MPSRKLSPEQQRNLAERYRTPLPDGTWLGATTLAHEFGIAQQTVYNLLAEEGIPTRDARTAHANGKRCKPIRNLPKGEPPTCRCGCGSPTAWNRRKNRWNRYVLSHYRQDSPYKHADWLFEEYITKRRTIPDIANECGVCKSSVRKEMRKHGIRARQGSDAHLGFAHPHHQNTGQLTGRMVGSLNPAWKGGVAQWEYSPDWKRLAHEVRNRDKWTCQDCGQQRKRWGTSLHVHHIDGNKLNNAPVNLVSLCANCHRQRHR